MSIKRLLLNGLCLAIPFFVWPMMSLAGAINLPQTGQTTCYDNDGNVISCTGTGQDGDVRAGVAWPEPRFMDNGDGTITDHLTGLIWLKNANCFGIHTWDDAITYSNSLASGSCGLNDGSVASDWRLPNVVELESLVNIGVSNPASWLSAQGFTIVKLSNFWSASTNASNTSSAWVVDSLSGLVFGGHNKANFNYVWPVRGGQ